MRKSMQSIQSQERKDQPEQCARIFEFGPNQPNVGSGTEHQYEGRFGGDQSALHTHA